MTDKRILKTKKALKDTLVEMMKQQSFQKVKVKDICEQAGTSKLTFYTHYDDKYSLLQDLIIDIKAEVMVRYQELQKQDSKEHGLVKHNQDMLLAIMDIEKKYAQVFMTAEKEKNYSFLLMFYETLIDSLTDQEPFLCEIVRTNYPPEEITSFLITGLWGYRYTARKNHMPEEQLKQELLRLAADLSRGSIFTD